MLDAIFTLHSDKTESIEQLDLIQRSLLFAEIARVAYLSEDNAKPMLESLGFHHAQFFDKDGSQAYIFENDTDCVVACRGTEPNEWNDIKADANAVSIIAETIGRVHRGFKQEVDDLWPTLEKELVENKKILWFCGHSLGGAMATICAGRCFLSHIPSTPAGLFTYGSPRVGNNRYVNHVKLDYFRWVNNNDLVTHVPPAWLGYKHTGQEVYINAYGRVRQMTGWQRVKDRWRGLVMGIKQGKIDSFADHSIKLYIEFIYDALEHVQRNDVDAKTAKVIQKNRLATSVVPTEVNLSPR